MHDWSENEMYKSHKEKKKNEMYVQVALIALLCPETSSFHAMWSTLLIIIHLY